MGKIVSNFFISLDGVVEAPNEWHFPYWSDEMGEVVGAGFETTEAMLMGRTLYDEWAAYWPTSTDEPVATLFNDMPKYVVSDHLERADWNNTTVIGSDVAAGVRDLKAEVDADIAMSGSATTVRWLLANGLLDELRLLVHPLVIGSGRRLFEDGTTPQGLELVSGAAIANGVLDLAYVPAAS